MVSPITIDPAVVQQLVDQAVQENILNAVENLSSDPAWLARIEHMINQTVVQETITRLKAVDLNPTIKQCVDESMSVFRQDILKQFASTGIQDQATAGQLTVNDTGVTVNNQIDAPRINIAETATVQNLIVKGTINTDNSSWQNLTEAIGQKTLDLMTEDWLAGLVHQVTEQIQKNGIDFDQVTVNNEKLIDGSRLAGSITETNILSVGPLRQLTVAGEAYINETFNVVNNRVGINTTEPEMALSVWDEEVSVVIGKNKSKQAYIGTNRDQGIAIGVNRIPQIEIDAEGLTRVKKLQVGVHRIAHDVKVPGWSGTRGDIVFNASPGDDSVFAWVCLGAFKWKALRSAE
jgi:predicted regulator of amino acid metabolism with ACT domain